MFPKKTAYTMANGYKTINMDKEEKNSVTEMFMKELFMKMRNKAMVRWSIQKFMNTKVNSKTTSIMEKENILLLEQRNTSTLAISKTE